MRSPLITDVELAERFQITVQKLHVLRKRHGWPATKLGRFEVRFTEAQVEAIVAMHELAPERSKPRVRVAGQTARSAARRRAS